MKSIFLRVWPTLTLAVFLAGCFSAPTPEPVNPTASVTPTSSLPRVTLTPTPQPTLTALPGKALLVVPQGSDPLFVDQSQKALSALAASSGWTVNHSEALQASDLTPEVRLVVLLSAPANLNDLLTAAPQTQFIVLASADLNPLPNLSVIRVRLDYQAFVAGFISEILSTDYRSAGLLPADGPLADSLKDAFANGGHYFCGVCAPGWPLRVYYPDVSLLPTSSDGAAWQAAVAKSYDQTKVDVVYVSAEAAKPEVWSYLVGKDQLGTPLRIVSAASPPDELKTQWAVTITFDLEQSLNKVWADVSTSKTGETFEAPLIMTNINSDNLGEGKLRLVNDLLKDVSAGNISPFSVPAQ